MFSTPHPHWRPEDHPSLDLQRPSGDKTTMCPPANPPLHNWEVLRPGPAVSGNKTGLQTRLPQFRHRYCGDASWGQHQYNWDTCKTSTTLFDKKDIYNCPSVKIFANKSPTLGGGNMVLWILRIHHSVDVSIEAPLVGAAEPCWLRYADDRILPIYWCHCPAQHRHQPPHCWLNLIVIETLQNMLRSPLQS